MGKLQRVELTNMCMICDGNRVLVQERKNPNWPGVIFPGGHVEAGESFVDSVVREIKEELGLDVERLEYMQSYPYDKKDMLMLCIFHHPDIQTNLHCLLN